MLPIFNISLIGRVDTRRRARSERAFSGLKAWLQVTDSDRLQEKCAENCTFTHADDSRGSKAFIRVCLCAFAIVCLYVCVCLSAWLNQTAETTTITTTIISLATD